MESNKLDFDVLRNGSAEQRAMVLNQFRDYLRSIAKKWLDRRHQNKLSVSDFVQRAIIQADQCIEQCEASDLPQFKAWLRQILIHEIFSRYRHLNRAKRDVNREQEFNSSIAADGKTPSQEVILEEERQLLFQAIENIKPEYQQVILARHRDDKSFVQIAEEMACTPDAARMLWNRAIKHLSSRLKPAND